MNIQGISALVTGGGSGLGEATARELAKLGAKVAVLDLNLENAQKVAADIGLHHFTLAARLKDLPEKGYFPLNTTFTVEVNEALELTPDVLTTY